MMLNSVVVALLPNGLLKVLLYTTLCAQMVQKVRGTLTPTLQHLFSRDKWNNAMQPVRLAPPALSRFLAMSTASSNIQKKQSTALLSLSAH
jgi:hypothetical protein